MCRALSFLIILVLLFCGNAADAQKKFVEGKLLYKVSLKKPGQNQEFDSAGSYTILLKGEQVMKELELSNGYSHVLILNENLGTIYSLKASGRNKLAVQLNWQQHKNKQKRYEHFTVRLEDGRRKLAGYEAEKAFIQYPDGMETGIFFTNKVLLENTGVFDRLPGFSYLPVLFEISNRDGVVMRFEAEKIDFRPVEDSYFRLPPDYKVISYKEYKKMSR